MEGNRGDIHTLVFRSDVHTFTYVASTSAHRRIWHGRARRAGLGPKILALLFHSFNSMAQNWEHIDLGRARGLGCGVSW